MTPLPRQPSRFASNLHPPIGRPSRRGPKARAKRERERERGPKAALGGRRPLWVRVGQLGFFARRSEISSIFVVFLKAPIFQKNLKNAPNKKSKPSAFATHLLFCRQRIFSTCHFCILVRLPISLGATSLATNFKQIRPEPLAFPMQTEFRRNTCARPSQST